MVVLSDKNDYGSFAELSSSPGILISAGGTTNSGHPHSTNVHNSNNSRPSSVSSNSNSLSSSVKSVGSEAVGGGGGRTASNNSNNNTRIGASPGNPNVHVGLGLELGLGVNKGAQTFITEPLEVEETSVGREGTRIRASSSSRIRNTSGNNNTYSTSSQPTLRLSPTDTIVIVNTSGGKTCHGNGTTTQPYSNSSSPMSTNSGDLLYQRQPLLQECDNGWIDHDIDVGDDPDSPVSLVNVTNRI